MTLLHDWEFNVLGIYNYRKPGKLKAYYDWIWDNSNSVAGDILEAGVFRGRSLLATALLLKELGSKKRVLGFDTYDGFPPVYDHKDQIAQFKVLLEQGKITTTHMEAHNKLAEYRKFLKDAPISVINISSSEDFSGADLPMLQRKAKYLGLDNIDFVAGDFSQTMSAEFQEGKEQGFSCCLLDCDLYKSYQASLAYIWPRLSRGGFIFLDEYFSLKFPGARFACDEFFARRRQKPTRLPSDDDFFQRWGVHK